MLRDGAASRGQPQFYNIFGIRTIRIHPAPSSEYAPASPTDIERLHIWKYKKAAHLQEGEDITELKEKHIPLLLRGAYAFGARFDELGDYASTKLEYEKGILDLFFDQSRDLDRPRQTAYSDL
jgi:hypothetical protein